jgi:chitinase
MAIVAGVVLATGEAAGAAVATVPAAPTGLTVTVGHYGLAELNWNQPASDGGSPVLDFIVNSSPDTGCISQSSAIDTHPYAQCEVSYGVTYTFSVAAENDVGTSGISKEVSGTPVPMLSVANASVVEGNSGTANLNFVVTLDGPSALPVSAFYTTADRTAVTGNDYSRKLGTVSFAPGQTSAVVSISVNGDSLYEANETMTLSLHTAVNAVFRRWVGVGTIINDDTPPSVSVLDTAHAERNVLPLTGLRFTISLSTLSGATTKVTWSTSPGTATAGSDYIATGGTALIGAGKSSGVIVVKVIPDRVHEANETLFVHLVTASGATINRAVAQGTILNDD